MIPRLCILKPLCDPAQAFIMAWEVQHLQACNGSLSKMRHMATGNLNNSETSHELSRVRLALRDRNFCLSDGHSPGKLGVSLLMPTT